MFYRYQLPLKTPVHDNTSAFQCLLPPEPDPLLQLPYVEMLKFSWNRVWHGDVDALVRSDERATDKAGYVVL